MLSLEILSAELKQAAKDYKAVLDEERADPSGLVLAFQIFADCHIRYIDAMRAAASGKKKG